MKKRLINIREFFWPLLDPEDQSQRSSECQLELYVSDNNIDTAYELVCGRISNEEDRRKGTETKAAMLLSAVSIASSLVLAANTLALSKTPSAPAKLSILFSFILVIYSIRVVWFSIKALERQPMHILGLDAINQAGDPLQYKRNLITKMEANLKKNQVTVNGKLDNLAMAQEYFKRTVIIIGFYAFVILSWSLWPASDSQEREKNNDLNITLSLDSSAKKVFAPHLSDGIKVLKQKKDSVTISIK